MISSVILAKNEEENIKDCLESVSWCNETIVVDDYSSDKTVQIAKRLGAKVFKHHLNGDFAAQRNYGLEKAKGEWILFVDADERVSGALAEEIKKVIVEREEKRVSGFYLRRRDFVFGAWLNFGETGKAKLLRLARKDAGRWIRPVHEVWDINGVVATLENPLLHYPHKNVAQFLKSLNWYTSLHASVLAAEGKKSGIWQVFVYPLAKFSRNFFFYGGFRDQMPGFLHALFMSFHSFLAQAKLWLRTRKKKDRAFIALLLFVGATRLLLINPMPSLFDAKEYVTLSQKSFVEAISLGHRPGRPGYVAILFIVTRFFHLLGIDNPFLAGGILSLTSSLVTALLFYFLLKHYLSSTDALKASFLYLLLPIVSFLSTTLAPEPVALSFLLGAFFLVHLYLSRWQKPFLLFSAMVFLALSLLINGPLIFWLPALFILSPLCRKKRMSNLLIILLVTAIGAIGIVTGGYLAVFLVDGLWSKGSLINYFVQDKLMYVDWYNFPLGTLRFLRNIVIGLFRDYTPPIVAAMSYSVLRLRSKISRQKFLFGILIVALPALVVASFMSVDFQGRRNLPLALVVSTLASIGMKKRRWFIVAVVYLFVTITPVLFSASSFKANSQPIALSQQLQREISPRGLYIHSHYIRPFVEYPGETYSLNEPGFNMDTLIAVIDSTFVENRPVYLESQAVFDPYLFYGGTMLHMLGLGRFGYSDARALFLHYKAQLALVADANKRIYLYRLFPPSQKVLTVLPHSQFYAQVTGKALPGQPILIYSRRFFDRVLHQRQDYYDPITWLWVLISGRHEPIVWGYADATGNFVVPVGKYLVSSLEVRGASYFTVVP